MYYLGVDVAKAKLDCMLLDGTSGKRKSKVIPNTPAGFAQLLEWLDKQGAPEPHVVMEPTGVYHEPAALALTDAGLTLSLVNPAQLRQFAQGLGVKTKTDKADSTVLARFGQTQQPEPWQPPSRSARTLKALLARRDAVADDLQRERNRQEAADFVTTPDEVKASIIQSIGFLEAQLKHLEKMIHDHIDNDPDLRNKRDLLETIPGVGERVSTNMTALSASRTFERAEQVATYLAWCRCSGNRDRPCMAAHECPRRAGAPAQTGLPACLKARQCNPHIKALGERLLAKGK